MAMRTATTARPVVIISIGSGPPSLSLEYDSKEVSKSRGRRVEIGVSLHMIPWFCSIGEWLQVNSYSAKATSMKIMSTLLFSNSKIPRRRVKRRRRWWKKTRTTFIDDDNKKQTRWMESEVDDVAWLLLAH